MGTSIVPMPSNGFDHDALCKAPGAPSACLRLHPFFEEALYHDCVVNIPYNPLKDYYSINLPVRSDREKLVRYEREFWICPLTEEEAQARLKVRIRRVDRRNRWWEKAILWVFGRCG